MAGKNAPLRYGIAAGSESESGECTLGSPVSSPCSLRLLGRAKASKWSTRKLKCDFVFNLCFEILRPEFWANMILAISLRFHQRPNSN